MSEITLDGEKYFDSDWCYDLESYPNVFTMTIVHTSGKHLRQFEISDRKNQIEGIAKCLRYMVTDKKRMIGFNNVGYDYHLIHMIIEHLKECKAKNVKPTITAYDLYLKTQEVINKMRDDGRMRGVRDENVVVPQVDLFLVNHFDNKARSTSLKVLEFNMRSKNIEDLPFPVGMYLKDDEIDVLLKYNSHDVMETLKFYYYCHDALLLRQDLTQKFGFDCTNYNDTKIGKELFINSLEKKKKGICYTESKKGRKINQTKRDKIIIKDCIFDYVKFDRPEFQAILSWLQKQVITETKGVFSDILERDLGDVAKYAEMVIKRKKLSGDDKKDKRWEPPQSLLEALRKDNPMGWVEEKELKSPKGAKSFYWCWKVAETLNVVIDDFRYDFGVGGIHGATQGTIRSTEKRVIRTLDVASYYPNMAIANNVYPEHLDMTFCGVYKQLYDERKSHAKGTALNAALKLALNGTYGDSNNEYSPLYDPKYTMTITIGGQLSLCMLMEKLINHCDVRIVMCNTDGFEFIVDKDKLELADQWVKKWEKLTGLEMEGDFYAKMFIRDVNNYISVTDSGKVKTKGAYEVLPFDKIGWHKNQSAMIVPIAVEKYLVHGVDYIDAIMSHKEVFDFMLRTKVPRSSRLVLDKDGVELQQQNICRYYPCKVGGKLIKIMPPDKAGGNERRFAIDAEWNVKTCNNMDDFGGDIDYDYYISKAKELIDAVSKDVTSGDAF